jgi:hypothetical protein
MKSRKMRFIGHVALVGLMRKEHKILVGNLKGRKHAEDLKRK